MIGDPAMTSQIAGRFRDERRPSNDHPGFGQSLGDQSVGGRSVGESAK